MQNSAPTPGAIARVIIDRTTDREFDYRVPEAMLDRIVVGSRVRVPVRNRLLSATVVDLPDSSPFEKLRDVDSIAGGHPVLRPVLLRMARWMADYYCCPVETAMRAVLPQVIRDSAAGHRERLHARLLKTPDPGELAVIEKRAPRQADVLRHLLASPGASVALTVLQKKCGASRAALDALEEKGWVTTQTETVWRDPYGDESFLPSIPLTLNGEQAAAHDILLAAIADPAGAKPILLHGVTGSGKTEIYLQGLQAVLDAGKSAIVLVPEISLTPQTVERFKSRFSSHGVAVLHSHLSGGERHDEWHRIHTGKARIVIGARSAVFAPLDHLGLIVVDEEHENSYKQEEAPRYHARDLAVLRASMEPCAVLLGSATPSLESYHNAVSGKYRLVELRNRVDDRQMPHIRIVDMRMRSKKATAQVLSDLLVAAIGQRLERSEQTILFLNRRGFNTSLTCPACGHVCGCPNCSVALTYHRGDGRLVCHLCGHIERVPAKCPKCSDAGIKYAGTGTEKVEDAVARIFPKARLARMDADAMTRKEAYRETLGAFRAGKIDILVGTQMIAKGLHFPNVTLVGIVNADLTLHLPDFRAAERTFQLLVQVAGRAGRGEVNGEVFVQSHTPFSPAIQFARQHDFAEFWDQEREFRAQWSYPPFSHMVLIHLKSGNERLAEFSAETLHRRLKEHLPPDVFLGEPAPAPLKKSKGQYRFHIVLRTPRILPLSRYLREKLAALTFPEDVHVAVDVDPYQLL